jgi:hypothetical protein
VAHIRHKYHAKPTTRWNIRFGSKAEARYYDKLLLAQKSGRLVMFLRQVPFHLPGGTVYRADFMEFWDDGAVRVIDVKGVETEAFKIKKREVEAAYPVEIVLEK